MPPAGAGSLGEHQGMELGVHHQTPLLNFISSRCEPRKQFWNTQHEQHAQMYPFGIVRLGLSRCFYADPHLYTGCEGYLQAFKSLAREIQKLLNPLKYPAQIA